MEAQLLFLFLYCLGLLNAEYGNLIPDLLSSILDCGVQRGP